MARPLIPAPGIAAGAAELAAAAVLGLAAAVLLAWAAGRRGLLVGTLAACVLLLPLAHVVTGRAPRPAGAAALAVVLLPVFAAAMTRFPAGQWGTARRLGASPALILRRLVWPALWPFLLASLLAGGLLLACRRPPPPLPLLLPYPASETG